MAIFLKCTRSSEPKNATIGKIYKLENSGHFVANDGFNYKSRYDGWLADYFGFESSTEEEYNKQEGIVTETNFLIFN